MNLRAEKSSADTDPFPLQTNNNTFICFEIADADWLNYTDKVYDTHTNIIGKQKILISNLKLQLTNKDKEILLSKKITKVDNKISLHKQAPFIIGGMVVSFGIGAGLVLLILK